VSTDMSRSAGQRMAWRLAYGALIAGRREELGLTQQEVADAAGLTSLHQVSQIENARCSVPPEKVAALALALQFDPVRFARVTLRTMDPWTFALIFGADAQLKAELKAASMLGRLKLRRAKMRRSKEERGRFES
jgi:transcriptional regulator with XRE-family HTH domain